MDRNLVRVNENIETVSTANIFYKFYCLEIELYYFGEF